MADKINTAKNSAIKNANTKKTKIQKKVSKESKKDFFALPDKEYDIIRDELLHCNKPLYFFHDDADGVSSFLQLYRFKREGKGVIIKSTPLIDKKYIRKVQEYGPDKIFILDIADVEQDFIDCVGCPVVWIDHHGPFMRERVKYFNPRIHRQDSNPPVSYLVSKVVNNPDDEWIAMAGMAGDWFLPPDYSDFSARFPKLLPKKINAPQDALFSSDIGKIAEIFNFIIKGTAAEALKYVKIMTRIRHYDEILKQTTSQGAYIYKRYENIKKLYDIILTKAKKKAGKSSLIVYEYSENNMSFTGEISNELLFLYPNKVILIAREKSGQMKCSIRSAKFILPPIIESALFGLEGKGGGHEHACGAVIDKNDFKEFIKRLKAAINSKPAPLPSKVASKASSKASSKTASKASSKAVFKVPSKAPVKNKPVLPCKAKTPLGVRNNTLFPN